MGIRHGRRRGLLVRLAVVAEPSAAVGEVAAQLVEIWADRNPDMLCPWQPAALTVLPTTAEPAP